MFNRKMINSRLRESSNLFDCYFETELDPVSKKPRVHFKYPSAYNDKEVIRSVPDFCFPCDIQFNAITHFSFVLTAQNHQWSYFFVRHHGESKCLVLMSSFPWATTFFKLLNYISDIKSKYDERHFGIFLESLFKAEISSASLIAQSQIYYVDNQMFSYKIQMSDTNANKRLPCIPDDRNLTEFYNAIDPPNMIKLFAAILNERRIIIHSTRLVRLTACVQACNLLLYPMEWQNVFIPIVPVSLIDYLNCPTPYIIGLHTSTLDKINLSELEDGNDGVGIVLVDADSGGAIENPFNDINKLPYDVVSHLKKGLKKTNGLFGDGLARLFLRAIILMIGGYRQALRFTPGERIKFDDELFIKSRPPPMQPFLEQLLQFQHFRQFVENRLEKLNSGLTFDDCFDLELNNYSVEDFKTTSKFKAQYQEWLGNVKKESSNLVKTIAINPVKSINPSMKSAYKAMKDKSKKTYKQICGNLNQKSNGLNRNPIFSSNLDLSSNHLYRQLPRMSESYSHYGKFYNET